MTTDSHDMLTHIAQSGVRSYDWDAGSSGAAGASALSLLGAAGLAPLLRAILSQQLAVDAVLAWLRRNGGPALADWLGALVQQAAGTPLASPDPAAQHELAGQLDTLLAHNSAAAADLAQLLAAIDAVPLLLTTLQHEVSAHSDLLEHLRADMTRLGLASNALEDALVTFGQQNQFRDVTIGAVAGHDLNQNLGDVIYGTKIVQQAFTPRPVAAPPEEIAAAMQRLAAMPTDTIPDPSDVLPPGSWLAQLPRNRQFVGRAGDLRTLATLLKGGTTVSISQTQAVVASGLGGIGKTQLAIEFAYRYGRYFAGVFWLLFAQPEAVSTEIARCGGSAYLQLFTEAAGLKLEEQVALVRARWGCGLPYLLIFDNCEDPDLIRTYHPGGATRVLITSRNPDWPGDLGVQGHALGVLQRAESIALLRQQRPTLSDSEADALAAELGDLPLALHLAGRFLAGPGKSLSVARYLAELRSPRIFERLPLRAQDGRLPTGHGRDVARTFALSYERLDPQQAEDALALQLLARTVYLVPGEVIPTALLQATLETDPDDLDGQLAAEAALERLLSLGLLERVGDAGLRMHRLVGAYGRQVRPDASAQAAVERVVLELAQQLAAAPTFNALTAFQPILTGVTEAALARADTGAALLCTALATHLRHLGAYAAAQPYVERALALREQLLGTTHPLTAESLNTLAEIYRAQGNYDAARPLAERALAICEQVLGAEHPATAQSLNTLAALLVHQGEYAAARPLAERALALRERVLGPDHPHTADSLTILAVLLKSQGEYAAARPLYERALALRERVLGPDHPHTVDSLTNLAVLHHMQGDYGSARPLYERAVAIRERVLGMEHPTTATTLHNLAAVYDLQGNYAAARPLYERALAICERVLGAEHPYTAHNLNSLAELYRNQGNYNAARPLAKRALAVRERVLGTDHPYTAYSLTNLAKLLERQGEYAAARPLAERALSIRERVLGAEHPDTAQSLTTLAGLLAGQEDYAAARPLAERAVAIRERVLGAEHPETAESLTTLAGLLAGQGDYAAARPLAERAVAIRERVLGAEHPETAESLSTLSRIASAQGDLLAAEWFIRQALGIWEDRLGPEHPDTQQAWQHLAAIQRQISAGDDGVG